MTTLLLDAQGWLYQERGRDLKVSDVSVTELDLEAVEMDVEELEDVEALLPMVNAAHIVSSPYNDLSNQLNLQSLDHPNRLFAIALTCLSTTRPDFRIGPYLDSFNWSTIFSALRAMCVETRHQWQRQEFYVVIFRSKLRIDIDRNRLGELDKKSHEEACASGGLLKYWFGTCDDQRRNLATCIWRNRQDAAAGGQGPWHQQARGAARVMYEQITFHTHRLVVEPGAESWRLEDYSE